MFFVVIDEIFPIKYSNRNTKLDVVVWEISTSSRIFLSPETELFFVKTHIIHALGEITSEAYTTRGRRPSMVLRCLCPCSTGRRPHGAHTAYENNMNRYAVRSPRWFGGNNSGTTISHVLRINCVSMAHGWRTCGAYRAWMAMPLRMVSRTALNLPVW